MTTNYQLHLIRYCTTCVQCILHTILFLNTIWTQFLLQTVVAPKVLWYTNKGFTTASQHPPITNNAVWCTAAVPREVHIHLYELIPRIRGAENKDTVCWLLLGLQESSEFNLEICIFRSNHRHQVLQRMWIRSILFVFVVVPILLDLVAKSKISGARHLIGPQKLQQVIDELGRLQMVWVPTVCSATEMIHAEPLETWGEGGSAVQQDSGVWEVFISSMEKQSSHPHPTNPGHLRWYY